MLPLERAVRLMTDVPARLFGLRDRGRVAPGWIADLAVLDPETVGAPARSGGPTTSPAARTASSAAPEGVVRVLVNGVETISDGAPTGARAGTVLRAGRDTTGTATS